MIKLTNGAAFGCDGSRCSDGDAPARTGLLARPRRLKRQ